MTKNDVVPILNKERLIRVDIMVGLMMCLVVLGHMNIHPRVPSWYTRGVLQWIYAFHMEVFVFLSGFLIRYAYKGVSTMKEYGMYVWKKFKKFFLWFIIVGVAAIVGNYAISHFFGHSDYSLAEVLSTGIKKLLLYPMWSQTSFLWYIYILFGFYLISPLYFKLPIWLQRAICVVTLLLPILPASEFLAAERFCKYTCFYCLGVQCAEGIEELREVKTWSWGILSIPFVAFSIWLFVTHFQTQESAMPFLSVITGFMALPFVYFMSMLIERCCWMTAILSRISKDCYWIYLLQMFIIWGLELVLSRTPLFNNPYFFIIFLPIAFFAAIAVPIFLKRLLIRKK